MVHKFWNVKLAPPSDVEIINERQGSIDPHLLTVDQSRNVHNGKTGPPAPPAQILQNTQNGTEEKVYRIWTVLSVFEESAAACISDMLLHVSVGNYLEGVKMADSFITHVEVLFGAIDDLLDQYHCYENEELQHEREARMLCKKVSSFFALLSHTQETGKRTAGFTQELLTLVTGLAHYLKLLIRIGLTGALKLERLQDPNAIAINRFLCHLMELAARKRTKLTHPETMVLSDVCRHCNTTCDDQCFKAHNNLWHDHCFVCSKCDKLLRDEYVESFLHMTTMTLICKSCLVKPEGYQQGFELVTPLQQYSVLLRTSLSHLYGLLSVYNTPQAQPPNEGVQTSPTKEMAPGSPVGGARSTSLTTDNTLEKINLGDIKRLKSTRTKSRLTDSHKVAKRSTLLETPSPNAAYMNNQSQEFARGSKEPGADIQRTLSAHIDDASFIQLRRSGKEDALTLEDIPELVAAQQHHMVIAQNPTPQQLARQQANPGPETRSRYFTELSVIENFMVKHIAVLHLEEMLREHFKMEELLDLIDDNKNSTLWGKFFTSFITSGNKKSQRTKEGTFGVPLEILIEKNGVESNLGMGSSGIRIPTFIDDSISAMKQMDMSIEGIFRKNGNIRRLKMTCEIIDKDPNGVQLINETPVQVAALTKKFLRELPDPLLTFKLYRLFIIAQKLNSKEDSRRATHLICCLLPKVNRDTMEVLFLFMKWVATFSHVDEESGSKMDLMNLATVLAPNILYPKSKDPAKEESFPAIEAVYMLLQYQEEFSTVPEDFIPLLHKVSSSDTDKLLNMHR